MTQTVTVKQLIPQKMELSTDQSPQTETRAIYEYEPNEETILTQLLPQNLAIQVFNVRAFIKCRQRARRTYDGDG